MGVADPNHTLHAHYLAEKTILEQATRPSSAQISWADAVKSLRNSSTIQQMMSHWRSQGTFKANDTSQAAEFLLIREFMSRPMRQNSMESLGLVQLDYPWIQQRIRLAPPDWIRLGQTLESWQLFLKVTLTYFVRNVP